MITSLSKLLFEELLDLSIIDIQGCTENTFDIDLPNGETVDCSEIADQFYKLFRDSKVRIMSTEEPYSALIDYEGNLFGGIVTSHELPKDLEDYDSNTGITTFSIVIDPKVRGQGWARKMIEDLLKWKNNSVIRAQVINPAMEKLLISMGFEKVSESGSREGLVYQF